MLKLSLVLLLVSVRLGSCIRCYQCRSDEQANCGDPFIPSQIQSFECNNVALQSTFSCYKMSTYVPGGTITVRGCAPFTSDFFPEAMQRGMAGTYWNGFSNMFSLCDVPNCNSSSSLKSSILMVIIGALSYYLRQ